MFPEYRDLITRLKSEGTNQRFLSLFDKHNALDHQVSALEKSGVSAYAELDALKKEKLRVKDELYALLNQAAAAK